MKLPQETGYMPDYDLTIGIDRILDTLTVKEKMIIRWRFGFVGGHILTREEIAKRLGYGKNRERIRQIEALAIRKLKHPSRLELLRQFR